MNQALVPSSPLGIRLSNAEQRVVSYMEQNGSISAQEAEVSLHNHRLAATIKKLRDKGFNIVTHRIDITNVYGEATWYGRYVFGQNDNK